MKQWLMAAAITITLGEGALVQGPFTLTDEGGKAILVVPKDGYLRGPAGPIDSGTILFDGDTTIGRCYVFEGKTVCDN